MSELDDDTQLAPAGEGAWAGSIHPRWNVGTAPNGGYLIALAARAMLAASDRPDPLTVTAHYVGPPEPGPVTVTTEVVRAGRRYATVAAAIRQGDRERVRLLGATGDLAAQAGPTRVSAEPPSVPGPDACAPLTGDRLPQVHDRYDLRLPPDSPWFAGPAGDEPFEVTGWIRFADGAPPSALALLAFADAFPPTVLNTLDVGWVPTIELTVHVRGRPAPGWVLGTFRTRFLVDGLLEEDGELWGEDGRLLAHARQLALILPRR